MKRIAIFLLTLNVGLPAFAANAEKPEDFALRFAVQTAPEGALQRVALPKEALAALQTASAADVRIFNAAGQAVPMARVPARRQQVAAKARSWPIYPIMAARAQSAEDLSVLIDSSLRIEETAGRRIVQIEGKKKAKPSAQSAVQVGTLVDTKTLKGALAALAVEAELAPGQLVALTVAASKDLKNWRTLAQDVPVFRFGDGAGPGSLTVSLNNSAVDEEYLRITWPQDAAFTLRGVRILPAASTAAMPRLAIPLPTKAGGGLAMLYPVAFATQIHALEVHPADANTLAPIHISGRSQHGGTWGYLGSGVAYRINGKQGESLSPPIELNGASVQELRIEVERGGSAFAQAPRVRALLAPQELVFVASGQAPFTLAVGNASAGAVTLPLASVIPGYSEGSEQTLPLASVNPQAVAAAPASTTSKVSDALGAPSTRSLVLWIVLLGGVVALGGVAWAVMRQTKR